MRQQIAGLNALTDRDDVGEPYSWVDHVAGSPPPAAQFN
jgi:hypothetical protein